MTEKSDYAIHEAKATKRLNWLEEEQKELCKSMGHFIRNRFEYYGNPFGNKYPQMFVSVIEDGYTFSRDLDSKLPVPKNDYDHSYLRLGSSLSALTQGGDKKGSVISLRWDDNMERVGFNHYGCEPIVFGPNADDYFGNTGNVRLISVGDYAGEEELFEPYFKNWSLNEIKLRIRFRKWLCECILTEGSIKDRKKPLTIYKAHKVDGDIKVKTSVITDSRDIKHQSDAWYETAEAALEYYHNHNQETE